MKISSYIVEEQIQIGVLHKRKRDIFKELLLNLTDLGKIDQSEQGTILDLLIEREKLGSTAIGHGIAIPHARVDNISEPLLVICVSREGVDFDSLDGELVFIIFLIISPKGEAGLHLKMLATISRLLRDRFLAANIREASTPAQVKAMLCEQEKRLK